MPNHLKTIISIMALILCSVVFYIDAGSGVSRWVALALGPLMVFSIWVFPEPKAEDVRRHAAERHASNRNPG